MKKKKIANEISQKVAISVLGVFIVVALIVLILVRSTVQEAREKELRLESTAASYQVSEFFTKYVQIVNQMSTDYEMQNLLNNTAGKQNLSKTAGYEEVMKTMSRIKDSDPDTILACWLGDYDTGRVIQSDGFVTEDGWDISSRPWYKVTETKTTVITEPYIDVSTQKMVITITAPFLDSDSKELIGFIGLDITLDNLNNVMKEYVIGKAGYIILTTSEGFIVYHPNSDFILKNMNDIDISKNVKDAFSGGKAEFLKFKVQSEQKYGYYTKIGETGWAVLSSLPESEFNDTFVGILIAVIICFLLGVILIVAQVRFISFRVTKPLLSLHQAAEKIAEGNLNVELNIVSHDEIGEVADSMIKTVERLKEYINYINEISDTLHEIASGNLVFYLKQDYVGDFAKIKVALDQISDSMNETMIHISSSAYQVSAGSDELANGAQILAENSSQQAAAVEELVATAISVSEQVKENTKEVEKAAKESEDVTLKTEESKVKMGHMMEAMDNINRTSNQVVSIIKAIEEIATQTNMLALNASIEAARAGEAGRGFAVVAKEIGKLADESSKAASDTRSMIDVSIQEVNKGTMLVQNVVQSLEEVVSGVIEINESMRRTADQSIQQYQSMEQIKMGIEEISDTVQGTSAAAQESSATSEELTAQATTLNELVSGFQLKR